MTRKYDESSVKVLKGLEAVRKKTAMYIGNPDSHGLFTIAREPADNFVDEALAHRCKKGYIKINSKTKEIWIYDDGQGIPVGRHKTEKVSTLEVVTGMLHGGGKDSDAYEASRGCFVGSTEIQLVDGRTLTMEQLYAEFKAGIINYVWTVCRKTGQLRAQPIQAVQLTKHTRRLVDVHLDTGDVFRCTPDHPLYQTSLAKVRASAAAGARLLAANFFHDSDGYLLTGYSGATRISERLNRVVADYYGLDLDYKHIHHIDENKVNNVPSNLMSLTPAEHYAEHPEKLERWMQYVTETSEEKSELLTELNNTPEFQQKAAYGRALRVACRCLLDGVRVRETAYNKRRINSSPKWDVAISLAGTRYDLVRDARALLDDATTKAQQGINKAKNFLASLDYTPGAPANSMVHDQSIEMTARRLISKAVNQLDAADVPDIGNYTPFELDTVLKGRVGCGALVKYIDLEEFISAYANDVDPCQFMYKDLSEFAMQTRALQWKTELFAEKSESWDNAATNRFANDFLRKVNAMLADGEDITYENFHARYKNAVGNCSWHSGRAACKKRGLVKFSDMLSAADDINHKVTGVHRVLLKEPVPVYDLVVPVDHNYRLACGVFVGNTHGIGIKCTNALSTQFNVATCREGVWHIVEYQKGVKQYDTRKATRAEVKALGSPFKKGTALYAKADMSIFDKGSEFDIGMFQEWCEIAAYFTPKLHITLDFDGTVEEYHFPNGMQDWFDAYFEESGASAIGKPFEFRTSAADIVVTWTDAESSELYGYTNGLYQVDGGTHINTFTDCIRDTLKPYAGARDSFTKEELCEGLLGAINFKISAPRFSSQTKEKLTDVRFTELVKEELLEALHTFWSKNKGMAREILKRATALRKFKQSVQLDRKALLELKQRKKTGVLPTKMATVRGITAEQREIFLVEGDSAGGTAKQARMKEPFRYQEVLALKGKVTNAMKAQLPKLMASEEVLNALTGIGYDPEAADPISKLRSHKIIMLSDPDPDGYHINALILALLAKLIPKVFDLGYVYALVSPKLVLNHNGEQYMAMTREELAKMLPRGADPARATYLKGWGEATVPLMRAIAFDPSKRRLLKIAKPTAKDLKEFEALMGDSPEYRKKLLGI